MSKPQVLADGEGHRPPCERTVVDTAAVAVERVRLGKQTVTEQQTVGGEVRKEEIELDRGDTVRGDVRDGVRDDLPADRR